MNNHTNGLEIDRLREQIESIERALETSPNNSEELEFRLAMSRQLLDEFLKPLAVVEGEYRALMQEFEDGKSIGADVVLNDIISTVGAR
jgi:hypothetical protein